MTARTPKLFAILCLALTCAFNATADKATGLPPGEAESVGMSAEILAQIPAKLGALVDEGKVPGFVTAVAREGKLVHFEAFGKRDVERDLPMTTDTVFRIYSMSKPITGAAIMILVDEGKIDVDDPVSKYIPEITDMKVVGEDGSLTPAKTPMTVKHLLTHTSGLSYGNEDAVKDAYREHRIDTGRNTKSTLEEFAARVGSVSLLCEPGTAFNYGISMDVLGRVVEVASGQSFPEFLQKRIFDPLGMVDTGFMVPEKDLPRFAANYGPTDEGGMRSIDDPQKSRYSSMPSLPSGGGGLVGTTADYLRFAQMLLNGGELDGVRVLSKEAVTEMSTNQLDPSLGKNPLGGMLPMMSEGIGFGYTGAVVMDGYDRTLFGSAGTYSWGGAASTDFWIDYKQNLIGIACTQLMPTGAYPNRVIMLNATNAAIVKKYD